MEHSQAEYVKGVSNWNFDVAALKASAAAEGPSLAPVPEGGVPMGVSLPPSPGGTPPGHAATGTRCVPYRLAHFT